MTVIDSIGVNKSDIAWYHMAAMLECFRRNWLRRTLKFRIFSIEFPFLFLFPSHSVLTFRLCVQ